MPFLKAITKYRLLKRKALTEMTKKIIRSIYSPKTEITLSKPEKQLEKVFTVKKQKKLTQKLIKPSLIITEKQSRILDLASDIRSRTAKEADSLVFLAKPFIQTTLPHRDPGNVSEWHRKNGKLTMSIRPGWGTNPKTGDWTCLGVPYGTIPRLLLILMSSHAIQTGNRFLELGEYLSSFMRKIGLDPKGKGTNSPTARLKNQMLRLFRSTVSFDYSQMVGDRYINNFMDMNLVKEGRLEWYPDNGGIPFSTSISIKEEFQGSSIYLSESFFECLTSSSVPLDERIVQAIQQSPLALDLYAWMVHRTYSSMSTQRPSFVTWQQLHDQFGSNYAVSKDFKRNLKPFLRTIQSMSMNLTLEQISGGLNISQK